MAPGAGMRGGCAGIGTEIVGGAGAYTGVGTLGRTGAAVVTTRCVGATRGAGNTAGAVAGGGAGAAAAEAA